MVDIERALLHRPERAIAAQGDGGEIIIIACATDDNIGIGGGILRAVGDAAAISGGPAFGLFAGAVIDDE